MINNIFEQYIQKTIFKNLFIRYNIYFTEFLFKYTTK